MESIIKYALDHSHSYAEYRAIVSELLAQGKSSGDTQSDEFTHYSQLNQTRMNRLEKTITIDPGVARKLQSIEEKHTWLVISEGWCGDAAQIVPVLQKMADVTPKLDLRIVFRDENPDLMNAFLTNGARSIPKLIILDEDKNVIADWGPRPKAAADLIIDYKAKHGVVDQTAKTELQLWYLHDKGESVANEVVSLMEKAFQD